MGPYIYYYPLQSSDIHSFLPIKAQNANMFIVQRMSATEYPNIFITNDFRNMVQLSTLQPQKNFRWMTTELIRWKMFNGMQGEGILYKPENFDHNKKYPIVFYFYEKDADGLYNFINPIRSNGTMNIAYFVSNGYLVFDPNIYYNIGYPGESAYNSVVSAAKYLSKLPWVDSGKMGLQGISWGGYEVNYLITRTNIFAAAASSAGLSNFISAYGSLSDNGHSLQTQFETGQGRIGANLWQKPELYIKNSPIFKADKVQTPLLIMHNKEDGAAPWSQAIEWFTALRRLNKKVWMLQYDGEGHGISQPKNQLDYSIRLGQFFDHYLKSGSEPRWLTEGVPASLKGIDLGLELSNK
jgi:dipeptidyl aminopeptidase/acylaminoacyl peptidase